VWDKKPGRGFVWDSIATGIFVPVIFLIAVLTTTGFSYRMGQTCLPNHENAIVTFWVWLVVFTILGFILQFVTTGYCVWIYIRTLRRERSNPSGRGYGQSATRRANLETWANVKKLFLLQWRNILVGVFVLIGSSVFFIVFWTQDSKLRNIFNDTTNIQAGQDVDYLPDAEQKG
jgi:amino acid transporter